MIILILFLFTFIFISSCIFHIIVTSYVHIYLYFIRMLLLFLVTQSC